MTQRIHVGNLSPDASEADVRMLFATYGEVFSCVLPVDGATKRRRRFGFVEMSALDAADAISGLTRRVFQGRLLKVSAARTEHERR